MAAGLPLLALLIPLAAATHIEQVAANVDEPTGRKHSNFVPLVAFQCGYRNKYMSESGEWTSDANRYATCTSGKLDILKYCKRAYPTLNVTNIVEYSHEVSVEKWCREEGSPCKWTHTVRPYRCIVGEFHSEALQVPPGCRFSHVNSRDQCNDYRHWKEVAATQCISKMANGHGMAVRSFAVLEPCGLDLFTGVEFVCCPSETEPVIEVKPVADSKKTEKPDEDDDEEYDDEYDEDSSESDEEPERKDQQDPYFKQNDPANEHNNFKAAIDRQDQKHRGKIAKVMKEWGELEARYKKMAQKDSKGAEAFKAEMTNRFQRTVAALEDENKLAKTELETLHEQRVQEALNEKKRQATHDYRQALALHVGSANKHNVLKTLKTYIRAEEKDRIHMLNRYRHLLRTDQNEAAKFKPILLHRLRYIDLRINGTLAMLRDFPDLESQVRPIALAFWGDLRKENTPEITDEEINKLNTLSEEAKAPKQQSSTEAPTTAATTTTPRPTTASKDKEKVLPDDSKDSEEEEDEYYEDEDDEEVRKMKKQPIVKAAEAQPLKLKPKPISVEIDDENEKKTDKKDVAIQTDDDDDDDEDDDSESDEDDELAKVKELRVDIEPIIEEKPYRDVHAVPAYYRHEKLVQTEGGAEIAMVGFGTGQMVIFVGAALAATLLLALVVSSRRRRAHAGFIEVDVCTPEERHLSGMQVTGYENPTYSFFDGKP